MTRMMRCCMLFVAVATCLLLTSSEAASSVGLRRVEDGGDGEADDAPAAPAAAPSESVPAAGEDEVTAPSVSPIVSQNDDEDEPTLAPASAGVPDDAANTAAPTRYLPDDETYAPTVTPTGGVTSAPSTGNNYEAPSGSVGNDSPVASPADMNDDEEGGDNPTDYVDVEGERPTEEPVPYVPLDDDPVKNEAGTTNSDQPWLQPGESPEEMAHDRNVLIAVSVICGFAFLLMIITAQQMMENPDGCCASTCRLVVGCSCCLFRTICFPCRAICGCGTKRGGRHHAMSSDSSTFTHDLELS